LAVDGQSNTYWRPQIHAPRARQVWIGGRFAEPVVIRAVIAEGLGECDRWTGGLELHSSKDGDVWEVVAQQPNTNTIILKD